MSGWVGVGLGVLGGAVIVGLIRLRGRRGRVDSPSPLSKSDQRLLGYLPIGQGALRRFEAEVPVVFEWSAGPVWRIARPAGWVEPSSQEAETGAAKLTWTPRAIELRGLDPADPEAHRRAGALLRRWAVSTQESM